jgi:hypothetical protein
LFSKAPGGTPNDRLWHFRDIARSRIDFRFRGKSGHTADINATTEFDPNRKSEVSDDNGAMPETFQIKPVRSSADLEATVQLFNAYASSVGIDLGYQDFATELATLPGKYAMPTGELLLARESHGEPGA